MTLSFSSEMRSNLKNEEQKRKLLDAIQAEKTKFIEQAEHFNHELPSDESDAAMCRSIIATVNAVLEDGNWEDSLFLRNTVKPLYEVREKAVALLEHITGVSASAETHEPTVDASQSELLYVSLFQNEGHNLRKWELQLQSMANYMVGRPIYRKREDIERLIRNKVDQTCEAYAVIAVRPEDIQADMYQLDRRDREGNELVSVKQGKVSENNIVEFVCHGRSYRFIKSRLLGKL